MIKYTKINFSKEGIVMDRELFVFAGQSNMVGGCTLPPKKKIDVKNSYEYKYKPRIFGAKSGDFVKAGYPVGEYIYMDNSVAYSKDMVDKEGKSKLNDHAKNAHFTSSMRNLKSKKDKSVIMFKELSESTAKCAPSLAPLLASEWEKLGYSSAYAHIAKGGVSITHYLNEDMWNEYVKRISAYNKAHGTNYDETPPTPNAKYPAWDCFFEKCKYFFEDAKKRFDGDNLTSRSLIWLQGESDAGSSAVQYEIKLSVFWEELKKIGFTHFFVVRVDYFGSNGILNVMQAQEDFAKKYNDAYILTRSCSYMTHPSQSEVENEWFIYPPTKTYRNCRDSYFGYDNHHINEKGFKLIAKRSAKNLNRVLKQNKRPILEKP